MNELNLNWLKFHPQSPISFDFKTSPHDFIVTEQLGFELSGEGEHAFLWVRKENTNTLDIIQSLSKTFSVSPRDIGFSGLKDKLAVTYQYFSLPAKNLPDNVCSMRFDGFEILEVSLHTRKLKRGVHASNQFDITLRNINNVTALKNGMLDLIAREGVPNYFGSQRFGHGFSNLDQGLSVLRGDKKIRNKNRKNLLISSVKSALFNQFLSERIASGCYSNPLDGEVFSLSGSRSVFVAEEIDETLSNRHRHHDIDIAAPMLGKGEPRSILEAGICEQDFHARFTDLKTLLEQHGEKLSYRPIRLIPQNMTWTFLTDATLTMTFSLPAGAFATSVIREIGDVN